MRFGFAQLFGLSLFTIVNLSFKLVFGLRFKQKHFYSINIKPTIFQTVPRLKINDPNLPWDHSYWRQRDNKSLQLCYKSYTIFISWYTKLISNILPHTKKYIFGQSNPKSRYDLDSFSLDWYCCVGYCYICVCVF